MNLNGKQVMSIIMAILGVLMISKSQLTPLVGANVADYVINAAGLVNMMLGSIVAIISGTPTQTAQVQSVLSMGGIEKLEVNKDASPELAKLAVDPLVNKISPTAGSMNAVAKTAERT